MDVGSKVWIHAMGSYYAGEIVQKTAQRVRVQYTSGAGKTRDKWATLDLASGKYINNRGEAAYPLMDGAEPRPRGARAQRSQ
jgi:hypothetical protein